MTAREALARFRIWWRPERVVYRPVPWNDAFVLEIIWRGVICHRYMARGVGPQSIEFRDERDGSTFTITGPASAFKCLLPDEIVHADALPPLARRDAT